MLIWTLQRSHRLSPQCVGFAIPVEPGAVGDVDQRGWVALGFMDAGGVALGGAETMIGLMATGTTDLVVGRQSGLIKEKLSKMRRPGVIGITVGCVLKWRGFERQLCQLVILIFGVMTIDQRRLGFWRGFALLGCGGRRVRAGKAKQGAQEH